VLALTLVSSELACSPCFGYVGDYALAYFLDEFFRAFPVIG
jgi:hypothetical protein